LLAATTDRALPPPEALDYITVATSYGQLQLTKIFYIDEQGKPDVKHNTEPKHFDFGRLDVNSLDDYAAHITALAFNQAVIPGRLIDGVSSTYALRRSEARSKTVTYSDPMVSADPTPRTIVESATLEDREARFILFDYDGPKGEVAFDPIADIVRTASFVRGRLPEVFHGARMIGHFTSSAGASSAVHMRAVFQLSRPMTLAQQAAWLQSLGVGLPFDFAIVPAGAPRLHGEPAIQGWADRPGIGANHDPGWRYRGHRARRSAEGAQEAP
jgi:hypothetical protein